ncbi:MAG TPA: fumarylacetoacetate hydrolase family protein [Pseudonocardia sp.]
MRLAQHAGRVLLVTVDDDTAVDTAESVAVADVAAASGGRFGPDPMTVFEHWGQFSRWFGTASVAPTHRLDRNQLDAPVPRPRQILAVGVNYAAHAVEAKGRNPSFFSKLPPCVVGPQATVELPTTTVDWEVEMVAVLSRHAFRVPAEQAWSYVAGLMVGQDLAERASQFEGELPQFSLAKSRPGFGPTGPWLTTVDEIDDPADLAICCMRNGEVVQSDRTAGMVQGVDALIATVSAAVPLFPGDLLFTGTPGGTGHRRNPEVFLAPGDVLSSTIEGLGRIEQRFVAGSGLR